MPKEKKDLTRMSAEELNAEIQSAKAELLDQRFQLATRQLKDVHTLTRTRRRVARAMTIARLREIEGA
jgi:ribosomal protein L29